MIQHIVLIRFRADVSEADITAIFARLHGLQGRLPGLLRVTSGRSESPERIERGYMHGFVAEFTDWAALAAYLDHPDHKRAGAALVAAADGGIDGILVFDVAVT